MMKRILSALCLLPCLAHAQTPFPFTVKGKIGQLNAPAKIYLLQGSQVLDSATFRQGAFELRGTTDTPKSASLVIKRDGKLGTGIFGQNDATQVYLESVPVVLTSPDSLRKATVTGGPVTADDQRLTTLIKPVLERQRKMMDAEIRKVPAAQRNTPAFQERMQALFDASSEELAQVQRAFIKANPNSWVSLDALATLNMLEAPQYAVVAPLYEALSPALKNTPQGKWYGEQVQRLKAVAVGAPAPAFGQKTPDGKTVSLADYRGKYVLVDFWASWCGPCRQENPALIKVYNQFKGRNFDILGVSLDDEKGREKWVKAIQTDGLTWTQVSDLKGWQNAAARLYGVQAIPQNFLIDPTGKIVAANLRGAELEAALAKYLK